MKRLFIVLTIVTVLFSTMPSKAQAEGLVCPVMWGIFNETTLDISILSALDTTVSGYVTDYKTNATFSNVYLGTATVKRLSLSYSLNNTNGLLAKLYFTQYTPLLGRQMVTECNIARGAGFFSIRIK